MGRVNWFSIMAFAFMALSAVTVLMASVEQALVYAVLAVAAAILAHLK